MTFVFLCVPAGNSGGRGSPGERVSGDHISASEIGPVHAPFGSKRVARRKKHPRQLGREHPLYGRGSPSDRGALRTPRLTSA